MGGWRGERPGVDWIGLTKELLGAGVTGVDRFSADAQVKGRSDSVPRIHVAGNEGGLHLGDGVVDRYAGTFVQDFDAVDAHASGGADFVGAGQGDIEGQDLIREPGRSQFFQGADGVDGDLIELIDGAGDVRPGATRQGRIEDRGLIKELLGVGTELGTDVVFPGDEACP